MSGIVDVSPDMKSGVVGAFGDGQIIRIISYAPATSVTQTSSSSDWVTFSLTSANLSGASKALIRWSHQFTINSGSSHSYCSLTIKKGSSAILPEAYVSGYGGTTPPNYYDTVSGQFYDASPDLTGQDYVWNVLPQYAASVKVQAMHATAFIIE